MSFSLRQAIDRMPLSVKPIFAILFTIVISGFFFFLGLKVELYTYNLDFKGFSNLLQDLNNPVFVPLLRFFVAMQTIALFAIPPIILALIYDKKPIAIFKLNKKPTLHYLGLSLVLILIANPFVNLLSDFNSQILDSILGVTNSLKTEDLQTQKIFAALLKDTHLLSLFTNTIIIALLPAVCEELFFRGLLQKVVLRKYMTMHYAVFLSAFIFSFFHFQFYGFIPRFILGIAFGYIFEWTGSLWITICIHFTNNFLAVFFNYLISKNIINNSIESIGTGSTQWLGYFGAILSFAVFYVMYRKYIEANSATH